MVSAELYAKPALTLGVLCAANAVLHTVVLSSQILQPSQVSNTLHPRP